MNFKKNMAGKVRAFQQYVTSVSPLLPLHLRKIMSVEGAIDRDEGELLYQLAAEIAEGCIVEIGSYRGRSTVALALGSQVGHNPPVYAIDPHEQYVGVLGGNFGPEDRLAFYRNMLKTGCVRSVRLINLGSDEVALAWSRPIGLLWIDGDHSYEAVKTDFENFSKHVITGGYIAFHDSLDTDLGPARVIDEISAVGDYSRSFQAGLITVLRKQN